MLPRSPRTWLFPEDLVLNDSLVGHPFAGHPPKGKFTGKKYVLESGFWEMHRRNAPIFPCEAGSKVMIYDYGGESMACGEALKERIDEAVELLERLHDGHHELDDLLRLQLKRTGKEPEFFLFVEKTCPLSMYFKAPFKDGLGRTFPTLVHWLMASRAHFFGDLDAVAQIISPGCSPAQAVAIKVKGFDAKKWEPHRFERMLAGSRMKFLQNSECREFLQVELGDRIPVYCHAKDEVWGIGLGEDNLDALNFSSWKGENLLGLCLLRIKEELIKNPVPVAALAKEDVPMAKIASES